MPIEEQLTIQSYYTVSLLPSFQVLVIYGTDISCIFLDDILVFNSPWWIFLPTHEILWQWIHNFILCEMTSLNLFVLAAWCFTSSCHMRHTEKSSCHTSGLFRCLSYLSPHHLFFRLKRPSQCTCLVLFICTSHTFLWDIIILLRNKKMTFDLDQAT